MSNNLHSEKEFVRNHYEQMILAHQKEETILVSHFGELSQNVISNLEGNVEEKITSLEISKGPIKKIFFISVETLQNMLIHGQKTNEGEQHNFFILAKNTVNIQIISPRIHPGLPRHDHRRGQHQLGHQHLLRRCGQIYS